MIKTKRVSEHSEHGIHIEQKSNFKSVILVMVIDSGASKNVVNHKCLFGTIGEVERVEIEYTDGKMVAYRFKGVVRVDTGSGVLRIRSVKYLPGPHLNTMSCTRLDEHAMSAII